MRSIHGGDWAGYESEYGKEPLDFSMNVNPLGMPEGIAKAIAAAALKADRYPDPECRRLRDALSKHEGVSCEWIFCGNGAADIIDRIALAFCCGEAADEGTSCETAGEAGDTINFGSCGPGSALVTAPSFSEYEQALIRCGWKVDHLKLDAAEGFRIGSSAVDVIAGSERRYGIIFICEPNNPTGITTNRDTMKELADACEKTGSLLVVDECFNGFLDEPDEQTMKVYLEDHPNLIILKAFTKIYGMAGVRLGYCLCSDREKLRKIRDAGQPWNVSYLAEEAGLAALREEDYIRRTRELIATERKWLKGHLSDLGIGEIYGEANYLLLRWPEAGKADAEDCGLPEALRRKGILIRDCSNFAGLDRGWYRIAVRKREDNEALIEAMDKTL